MINFFPYILIHAYTSGIMRMPLMSKKMKAFILVARYGSISEAARNLSLTVSPVSRLISELEEHCGEKLFLRKNNRIEITAFGEHLFSELDNLYDRLSEVESRLRNNTIQKSMKVYYDWGKDYYMSKIQEKKIQSRSMARLELFHMHDRNGDHPSPSSAYFVSEQFSTSFHDTYMLNTSDSLVLYHHRDYNFSRTDKILFLYRDQFSNRALRPNLMSIMERFGITKIVDVNSETSTYDLIRKGYGLGLTINSFWSETLMRISDVTTVDTNINAPAFLMLPKTLTEKKLLMQFSEILGEFKTL